MTGPSNSRINVEGGYFMGNTAGHVSDTLRTRNTMLGFDIVRVGYWHCTSLLGSLCVRQKPSMKAEHRQVVLLICDLLLISARILSPQHRSSLIFLNLLP